VLFNRFVSYVRYLRRRWRERRDYDDPMWWLFAGLAFWLFVLWLIWFYPE
jgi:hypothetical protein